VIASSCFLAKGRERLYRFFDRKQHRAPADRSADFEAGPYVEIENEDIVRLHIDSALEEYSFARGCRGERRNPLERSKLPSG
jgi:hypothetical protein